MAAVVATAFLRGAVAEAQSPSPTTSTAVNAAHHTVTVQTVVRRATIGGTAVGEEATPIDYRLVRGPSALRFSVTPVSFSANGTAIHGATPFSVRFDHDVSKATTIRVYGHTASIPGTLDAVQTSALGTAGTPTLDLDSFSLGTPALAGARVTQKLGHGPVTTSVYGTFEFQPRPGGSDPVYWRGRTVGGGLSLSGAAGKNQFTTTVDATRSAADDLSGRNLYPGGGTISLSASGNGPFGGDTLASWQLFGFYFRPINSSRPSQPTRLIPVGDFMGVNTSITLPAGLLLLWPSVDMSREGSHTVSHTGLVEDRIDGSGWTTNLSLAVTLPAGDAGDFTITGGAVVGAVSAVFSSRAASTSVTTDTLHDQIRGRWLSFEWSQRF